MTLKDEVVLDGDDKDLPINLSQRIRSTTKDSGARVILVFTNSVLASQLLFTGDESVMGGSGYAWLLNSSAMIDIGLNSQMSHSDIPSERFGVLRSGALGFRERNQVYKEQNPFCSYLDLITLVAQYAESVNYQLVGPGGISGSALRTYILASPSTPTLPFQPYFSNGQRSSTYDLYNVNDFVSNFAGTWNVNTGPVITSELIWPGFKIEQPNDKIPIVNLALLYPETTKNGVFYEPGLNIKNAFDLAIKEINANPNLLETYQIESVHVNTYQDESWASINIRSIANSNVIGYIGPRTNELVQAYLDVLSPEDDSKPLVSYGSSSQAFGDAEQHPRFLRTIQPDGLQAAAIPQFLQQQDWQKISVIYTSDSYGQGVYDSFLTNVVGLEISIENGINERQIRCNDDGTVNSYTKDDIEERLTAFVEDQRKIIVYLGLHYVGAEMAKVAHEKELYGSEYAWIGGMWINAEMYAWIDQEHNADKGDIMDFLEGAIGLEQRKPHGDAGEAFLISYAAEFNGEVPSTHAVFTYDTVYMFAHALESMLERGDDFNDGKEMTDMLRSVDFVGASGKVKIFEGSNDRSAVGYNIVNVQGGDIVTIGTYDPLNTQIFSFTESIQWSDDTSSPPDDDWDEDYDCPFTQEMVTLDINGIVLVICIGSGLLILALVLSYPAYRKWKQVPIEVIDSPRIRSWKDTMVQLTIFIEFFQFVAIAPRFPSLEIVIRILANLFLIDFIKMANEDKSSYWGLLIAIVVVCYLWFILVVLIMTDFDRCLTRMPFLQRTISLLNSGYLPFFGNTMFLPITAILFDPFVCDHVAQGEPFVWRDCYMNCWQGSHVTYVILAAVALAVYEPIAIFSRPLWQQAKTNLNIMSKPFFLLVKTCFQILLIAVGKSLQGIEPISHGVVFSVLILAFAIFTLKTRPFNYTRCNLWEFLSLMAVFYFSLLATICLGAEQTHYAWFISLAVGWGAIGLAGFLIQKKYYENLLVAPGHEEAGKKKIFVWENSMVGVAADFSAISSNVDASWDKSPRPEVEADESPLSVSPNESGSISPSASLSGENQENSGKLMPNISEGDEYK